MNIRNSKTLTRIATLSALFLGSAATLADPTPAPTTLRALYSLSPPSDLHPSKTALVLVDFQDEFVHGKLKLPEVGAAVARAAELAAWARRSGILVVNVRNVVNRPGTPLFAPGSPTSAFVPELTPRPGDVTIVKGTGGAFTRTALDGELRARGIDTLVVGGLMTHLAVLITATDATVLGYRVIVAADGTATRALPGAAGEDGVDARTLQRAALDTMADRAADVLRNTAILALPVVR